MKKLLALVLAVVVGVVLPAGCDSQKPTVPTEPPPRSVPLAKEAMEGPTEMTNPPPAVRAGKTSEAESGPPAEPKEPDLGPPLVEQPERLVRLDPVFPVFIDKEKKRVVLVGQVCQREVPLEMFACLRHTKEHEAIVTLNTKAMLVHTALLAVGAEPGQPAHFHPQFSPARGQEIEIEVFWKDAKGQLKRARAQDWIKNGSTGKALEHVWVFAGSGFWTDPDSGQRHYQAESGDLICVSNFSSATLDLTIQSSATNESLMFMAFTERIPPKGTPVTLVLTPQKKKH